MESLSRDELIQIIVDLHRMIEQQRAEIEQLKRRGSAAPFSKGTRKPEPKPPGRKPGQGFFRFRNPPEQQAEREAENVPVVIRCCPDCGGALGEARQEMVSTTDIPAQPQPEVRLFAVEIRQCRGCGPGRDGYRCRVRDHRDLPGQELCQGLSTWLRSTTVGSAPRDGDRIPI